MKGRLLAFFTLLFLVQNYTFGQCTNTSSYGSANAPTDTSTATISTCNWQTEYATISNVVAGETYEITNSCGGYITVRSGTFNGPVVGSGNAPFSFTATVAGNHYVHFNTNAGCGTATTCCTTEISCTSCAPPTAPANDDPCSAEPLNVNASCSFATFTNANATASAGVPAPGCASYSGGDVWFTATVPASGLLAIDTDTGVMTDSGMAIYSGTCGSLSLITCDDDSSANGLMSSITSSGLTPGSTIYIRVWEYGNNNNGTFDICAYEPAPPPANDDPCGAVSLTPDLACVGTSGTVEDATNSGIDACFGTPDNDVWYSFVATATSHNISIFNIAGSSTDMYHAVYGPFTSPDCSVAVGDNISCSDPNNSTVTGLTIGSTYFVQVFTYFSGPDNTTFDICVTEPPPPPPNDEPCSATALTPDIACIGTSGYVEGATNSGIDACFGTPDNDVWYSFVATDTTHHITLFNIAGSDFDLYHAVYGPFTSPDCSVAVGDNISCSDPNNSTVTGLTVGSTYFIQVFTYFTGPETTTFDICVTEPPPPPSNDEPCTADVLTPGQACIGTSGYVEGATNSGIDSCAGTPDNDVWYSFVATDTTHNVIISNVSGSDLDLYHAVYGPFTSPDCSVAVSDNISCSDANNSTVTGLTIGSTYYVQVFTFFSGPETTTFDICVTEPCALPSSVAVDSCPYLDVTPNASVVNTCNPALASATLTADFLDLGDTSDYDVQLIPWDASSYTNFVNAATTPLAISLDDTWSDVAYAIPFDFCFYGNTVTQFVVGANGAISFDASLANADSGWEFDENLPSTDQALFENSIYVAYCDIDPSVTGAGKTSYGTTSVNGCNALVIYWEDIPLFSNGNTGDNSKRHTAMAVLYENTNIIDIHIQEKVIDDYSAFYGDVWNWGNAIVGVQNVGATEAVVAPCRNSLDDNWATVNESWRFTPSGGSSIVDIEWLVNGVLDPSYDGQNSITVAPSATTTYTAQATYNWCNGSTSVETDISTVIVTGAKVWTGAATPDNDWMTATNWSDGLVPTSADCVIIPNTGNDPVIYDDNDGDGYYMIIRNGATLTLTGDTDSDSYASSVTIQDYIEIEAGGNLIVEDGASLIQVFDSTTATPPSASNTGDITLYRDTFIRQTDYVYWSSPVQNFDVSNVYGAFTPTNFIYEWTPTVPTGTNIPGIPPTGGMPICFGTWNPLSSGNMTAGKGYIVRGPTNHSAGASNRTATFNGVAHNGVYTQQILSGDNSFSFNDFTYNPYGVDELTVTPFDDNWNLLGNPYPSALDAQTFLTYPGNNIIEGAVHIWTHGTQIGNNGDSFYDDYAQTYDVSDYVTYNFSGTNTYQDESFAGKIASGQGFFVLALNDNESGNVTFANSMRDRGHSNTAFYRTSDSWESTNQPEKNRIWLSLVSDIGKSSNILVGYIEGATQDKDRLYDAFARDVNNLSFYSKIGDQKMIIQGRSLPFDVNDQVPLGTVIPGQGSYTIAIEAVDGLFLDEGQDIYLEDTYLNVIHDLRISPYIFSADDEIDYEDRFILRYTNDTLSLSDLELSALTILAPNGKYIKVFSDRSPIEKVTLYDILGRTLFEKMNIDSSEFIMRDHNFSDGPYIITVTLKNGLTKSQKIVLKK